MSTDLKNKILQDIEEKNISPRSSYYFISREVILWSSGILALIFGGLSSSVLVFALMNQDVDIYQIIADDFLRFWLFAFPYLWVFTTLVFILIARYNIRHTRFGYRHRPYTVILSSIFISIVLGFIFNAFGIGMLFDQFLIKHVPEYTRISSTPQSMWLHPEQGRLVGKIVHIEDDHIVIIDLHEREWTVAIEGLSPEVKNRLTEGMIVKLSGQHDDILFRAEFVKPQDSAQGLYRRKLQIDH